MLCPWLFNCHFCFICCLCVHLRAIQSHGHPFNSWPLLYIMQQLCNTYVPVTTVDRWPRSAEVHMLCMVCHIYRAIRGKTTVWQLIDLSMLPIQFLTLVIYCATTMQHVCTNVDRWLGSVCCAPCRRYSAVSGKSKVWQLVNEEGVLCAAAAVFYVHTKCSH